MKSSQSFFNENQYYITPSDIIEFLYCKRFIYFMRSLGIDQHTEKRFKTTMGKEVHKKRGNENKHYLRKRIASCEKLNDINLVSPKLGIRGKVDEIHICSDGSMCPLDFKYAVYNERLYKTYKSQIIMYSLMIEEVYKKEVKVGYIVYCREGNKLVEVEVDKSEKEKVFSYIDEYKKVLNGFFPASTKEKSKCLDCCYRNICIK
ncbi:CRISPR-associated protein Cas4 [Herbivorax sp. ANBcel31]|uniref:CRISPR-associated protein Cas4 n=1 Tax=Herbivorax sp. ANBcel31 TaxID=3069754 RepID=UPI0027AE6C9E|nr:CRISPR-associated protein Cas4 [Herbivorax sp. ANBcel31]MDQ2084981.1 CRISPR-associated protein Cas4 [Herbivorax sp. ANBcel31]